MRMNLNRPRKDADPPYILRKPQQGKDVTDPTISDRIFTSSMAGLSTVIFGMVANGIKLS